jgi:hypothetical protein
MVELVYSPRTIVAFQYFLGDVVELVYTHV